MRPTVIANNSTEAAELEIFASDPDVTLDVTNLDLSRLPQHVKAVLSTNAEAFNAPQLQTSGGIYAPHATSLDAPQLQTSGNITARRATTFSAPQLQTSGNITAHLATTFSLPQLQTSGHIEANSATSFSAPQLQTSGGIIAPKISYSQPARRATVPAPPAADRRAP